MSDNNPDQSHQSAKAPLSSPAPAKRQRTRTKVEDEKKVPPHENGGKSEKRVSSTKKDPAKKKAAPKAKRAQPSSQATTAPKARIGAPPKYKPEFVFMVEKMAILGLTDAQMSGVFGVTEKTFNSWKTEHPLFGEANARGKVDPNRQVEASLFRMAIGGFTIKKTIRDAEGNIERIIEEERPGDVAAATKWLFNRDPERWREKVEIEHSGTIDMTRLTPEEFEQRSKEILTAYVASLEKKPDAS